MKASLREGREPGEEGRVMEDNYQQNTMIYMYLNVIKNDCVY